MKMNNFQAPIGVFDSGYGGLTILQKIKERLPQYDYLYLGDNARAPYGTRSFDVIYRFTLEAVKYLRLPADNHSLQHSFGEGTALHTAE